MALTEQDLRGAAKKYESLPGHEKESIDRHFAEITKQAEEQNERRVRSADSDLQVLAKEVGTHCYRQIVNGGYFQIPQRHGGNVIKEKPMSEEEQKLERLVRHIVYDLKIEEAVEYLKGKVDLTKLKGA